MQVFQFLDRLHNVRIFGHSVEQRVLVLEKRVGIVEFHDLSLVKDHDPEMSPRDVVKNFTLHCISRER